LLEVIALSHNMDKLIEIASKVGTYIAKSHTQNIQSMAKYMAGVFDSHLRGPRLPPTRTGTDGRCWRAVVHDASKQGEIKFENGWYWFTDRC